MKLSDHSFWGAGGKKILGAKELSDAVYNTLKFYEDRADEARSQASKTREEVMQEIHNEWDEENQMLKERLRLSLVELNSQKELDEYNAFVEKHRNCNGSRIGDDYTPLLRQYYTGFGRGAVVSCPICGGSVDITDTSCW